MTETFAAEQQSGTADYELVSAVVEYETRADRCTIYHPESEGVERMSRWLSADRTCFIDLSAIR